MPVVLFCYTCLKNGEVKLCGRCRHAFYCSKICQRKHWTKHKPNCIPAESSLHDLFQACSADLLPVPEAAARDYGLDNMRLYHGDVMWDLGPFEITAEQILFGLYRTIEIDIGNSELNNRVLNSIGVTKKMVVEAFENNALDEFLNRYVRNVISRHGRASPQYCFGWLQFKLVIGPTRTEGLTQEQVEKMRKEIYEKCFPEPGAVKVYRFDSPAVVRL